MAITIAAQTVSGFWYWGGTTAILRIFSSDGAGEWYSVSGLAVPVGAPGPPYGWYKDVAITISGHDISIASLTLEPTQGALVGEDPVYSAYYYDSTGTIQYGAKLTDFQVGQSPSSTTWPDIAILNNPGVPSVENLAYTKAESDFRYASVAGLTPGYLPKVTSGTPQQLADSLFHDDGTDGYVDSPRFTLNNQVRLNREQLVYTGLNTREGISATAATGETAYFISGGLPTTVGRLGFRQYAVNLFGSVTLFTATFASLVSEVRLYLPSADLSGWAQDYALGVNGGSEYANGHIQDLGLSNSSSYAIIRPTTGAILVAPSDTFDWTVTDVFGSAAFVDIDVLGSLII